MKNIGNSLYWRISTIFLLIFIIVGIAYVVIAVKTSRDYYAETTQRLNAGVAEHLLLEVKPFVDGKVNEDALGVIMHSMMAVNPAIEVYLLDPEGEILSFVVLDKKVKLKYVDINPVKEFITAKGENYILGDDPRLPGRKTVFSATKVEENGQHLGYVYIVLASEQYETATATLQNSFILNLATRSFIITLIFAFLIGLMAIWLLTRNIRTIINTVRSFEEGDLHARINIHSNDELGQLATTYNNMADTILRNIEELKQVDNLRRDLIANVSHDLRTPLSVMHGYIETLMMKENELSHEKRTEYLMIVMKNTEKLKHLVADLFQLSKLEAKQVELKVEPFSLSELIQDLSGKYALMAEQKHIRFSWDHPKTISMVEADLELIDRVLQNLIDNAIKHTPENGEVKLKIENAPSSIEIQVSNTGSYISEEEIQHLFDRYYKGSGTAHRDGSTGLGLAIVKNILDLHHSVIRVSSSREEGTTFGFALKAI